MRLFTLWSCALLVLTTLALAADGKSKVYNVGKDRFALKGYDPVSYFDGKPLKGEIAHWLEHDGLFYRFATPANLEKFKAGPTRYAPAYGGWCATAMAKADKVDVDPLNYKITDGRLFLFYKGAWGDALAKWNKDEANLTTKADAAWKKLAGE